jgi:transposase
MFSEEIRMELRALHRHGWSIAALAREFNINRRTVARYVGSDEPASYGPRACPADLSEAQLAHVIRRLDICHKIRVTTLYREITELGYAGSYPSFARRVRLLRTIEPTEPEVCFETDPGVQAQIDWTELGLWPLADAMVELKAWVAVLGFSRAVALRFATDKTRPTTLALIPQVLSDLGGATAEILTDRDPALVIGETSDKRAIFAPEWVDVALSLQTTPKACRAYRAKTKGKVERVIREVKEDFVPWLTGQVLPARPSLADYDALARRWALEVVGGRRHRTTGRIVSDAWREEQTMLRPIPARLLSRSLGTHTQDARVIDLAAIKAQGSVVEHRSLDDYGRVAP